MTDLMQRTVDDPQTVPSHPHFTLGSVALLGLALAVLAAGIGIGGLFVTASRNSVDDALVAERIDEYVAGLDIGDGSGFATGSVIPELTPKAELQPAPADEVNVSYAPHVPPQATRTGQAIVDVHFEVVEQVSVIDPTNGTEYETWGYRIDGDDGTAIGTPGPMIRARVGDVLRFTITNPAENTNPHNVDFHAVTGQGGGAAATTVSPGETAVIEARLLYPGSSCTTAPMGTSRSTSRMGCSAASSSTPSSRCLRSSTSCTWCSPSTTRRATPPVWSTPIVGR